MFPILSETLFPSLSTSARKKNLGEPSLFSESSYILGKPQDKFICSQNVWTLYYAERMKLTKISFIKDIKVTRKFQSVLFY